MREFQYTIQDPQGLHARPAGLLAKAAAMAHGNVTLVARGTEVNAKKVIGLMRLCLKQGEIILLRIEGEQEEADEQALKDFCKAFL